MQPHEWSNICLGWNFISTWILIGGIACTLSKKILTNPLNSVTSTCSSKYSEFSVMHTIEKWIKGPTTYFKSSNAKPQYTHIEFLVKIESIWTYYNISHYSI